MAKMSPLCSPAASCPPPAAPSPPRRCASPGRSTLSAREGVEGGWRLSLSGKGAVKRATGGARSPRRFRVVVFPRVLAGDLFAQGGFFEAASDPRLAARRVEGEGAGARVAFFFVELREERCHLPPKEENTEEEEEEEEV